MSTAKETALLRDAVAAAKIGDKPLARTLLRDVLEANPNNEQAWLWRAAVAEDRAEAMSFLEKVLAINPENRQALSTLAAYRITPLRSAGPPPAAGQAGARPGAAGPGGGYGPARTAPPLGQGNPIRSLPPNGSQQGNPMRPNASAPLGAQGMQRGIQALPPRPAISPLPRPINVPERSNAMGASAGAPSSHVGRPPGAPPRTIINIPPRPINIPPRPGSSLGSSSAPHKAAAAAPHVAPQPIRVEQWVCPLCEFTGEMKGTQCPGCKSILALNDLDAIATNTGVDEKSLLDSIERNRTLAAAGGNFQAHLNLALAYLNLKSSADATTQIRAAAALQSDHVLLQRTLATLQSRRLILVVDDSQTIRKVISTALERQRYRVAMAGDGMQALAKLDEEMPDLILLDITMPRMDGYQVCKVIKQNKFTKEIPVVMLSGNDGFFDKVKGRMAGATDYLTKPFEPAVLLRTIQKYCNKK